MMSYRASRSVVRLHLNTSRTISSRANPLLFSFSRVLTAYDAKPPLECTPSSIAQLHCYRSYATRPASRPKAHTGRTTSSPRAKKPKATGETAEKQTTARVTKPKKTASKTKAVTKPKAKPKAKAKAKVRAKKPVTEEEKATVSQREQRAHIRELKTLALSPPKAKPDTVWTVVASEMSKERKGLATKEAVGKYRGLIPAELEVN